MSTESLYIFLCILHFFFNILMFSLFKSFTCLVRIITNFIFLRLLFPLFVFQYGVILSRNSTDFFFCCVLIQYCSILLKVVLAVEISWFSLY